MAIFHQNSASFDIDIDAPPSAHINYSRKMQTAFREWNVMNSQLG